MVMPIEPAMKRITKPTRSIVNGIDTIVIVIDPILEVLLSIVNAFRSIHFVADTLVIASNTMLSAAETIVSGPFLLPKNQQDLGVRQNDHALVEIEHSHFDFH